MYDFENMSEEDLRRVAQELYQESNVAIKKYQELEEKLWKIQEIIKEHNF